MTAATAKSAPDRSRFGGQRSRKPSQTDRAYARLKAMILAGKIGPTDQIDANRLIEVLSLGRTPIREALLRLQMEGIVRIVPKRGVQIVTLSANDIKEIYEVISAIEVAAVRILTESQPAMADLEPLIAASNRMIAAGEEDDREQWIAADEAFHRALLELNSNKRLRDVGLTHRDLAQRAHFVALRLLRPAQIVQSARQHKRLIKLIASGQSAAAAESHQVQRNKGAGMLVDVLRKYGLTQL